MWLYLFGVLSAQFVLLIERLDVTYFPKDCSQEAGTNFRQFWLVTFQSHVPHTPGLCFPCVVHLFLVILDHLWQANRSLVSKQLHLCMRPSSREQTYRWNTYSQVNLYSQEIMELMSSNKKWGKMLLVRTSELIWTSWFLFLQKVILNFKLAAYQHLFLAHCLKKLSKKKP